MYPRCGHEPALSPIILAKAKGMPIINHENGLARIIPARWVRDIIPGVRGTKWLFVPVFSYMCSCVPLSRSHTSPTRDACKIPPSINSTRCYTEGSCFLKHHRKIKKGGLCWTDDFKAREAVIMLRYCVISTVSSIGQYQCFTHWRHHEEVLMGEKQARLGFHLGFFSQV